MLPAFNRSPALQLSISPEAHPLGDRSNVGATNFTFMHFAESLNNARTPEAKQALEMQVRSISSAEVLHLIDDSLEMRINTLVVEILSRRDARSLEKELPEVLRKAAVSNNVKLLALIKSNVTLLANLTHATLRSIRGLAEQHGHMEFAQKLY